MSQNKPYLFLLSTSARAHAEAAQRGGHRVFAIDGFSDSDLQAEQAARVSMIDGQFTPGALDCVIQTGRPQDKLAYGSGFERNPDLLNRLDGCVQVLGNSSEILQRCADLISRKEIFTRLKIPTPDTQTEKPAKQEGWLKKRNGRSGGHHVGAKTPDGELDIVWQRRCEGVTHSAVFLAGESGARVVGISRQIPGQNSRAPYAFSGAIGPAPVSPETAEQVQWIANALTRGLGLLGLCGIDFILDSKNEMQVVDLNPRLTATCELYQDRLPQDYVSIHLQTCETGRLAWGGPVQDSAEFVRGFQVVYASCAVSDLKFMDWPDEACDLPLPDASIGADQPLCTVRGRWSSVDAAQAALKRLHDQIQIQIQIHAEKSLHAV